MDAAKRPADADMPWIKSYPKGIDWNARFADEPIHLNLERTAQKYPNRPAIDFMGKETTWADLAKQVDKMAAGLQKQGLKKGDKVAILLPNCPNYIVTYYATLKAGGTVVNLNPLYSEAEIRHMVDDSEADFLVTADLKLMMDKVKGLGEQSRLKHLVVCSFPAALPLIKRVLFNIFKRGDLASPSFGGRVMRFADLMVHGSKPAPVSIDMQKDIAVLQYTGGTTGEPKAAMLTHRNVSANVQQARMWFSAAKDGHESTLGVIPFFHVFAMTAVMNLSIMAGFKIIATPRFELKDTLKIINKQKPSFFPAVPAIYNAINNTPHTGNLSSLKFCVSGGAPLPLEVKQAFEKKTGGKLVEGYGLTESSPIACVNPVEGLNKPRSIGLPMPGTVVQIRDPETQAVMPQGERGELCIQGPQVMKGYWKNDEATKKTMIGDFLRTGDIATMDDEGYFFIVDRLKDMIITNGYKVYPNNVEKAIYANPKVEECIVAGIPDANRGEIVKAWIKPKAGQTITGDEIRDFIKDKLAPMEVPRQVEIRDKPLPKTMIGKLSRKDILIEEAQKNAKGDAKPAAPGAPGPG